MKKEKIILNEGEKIVFKASNVRQGFWGAYTNNLIITTRESGENKLSDGSNRIFKKN